MKKVLLLLYLSLGLLFANQGLCTDHKEGTRPNLYEIEADTADLPDSPYPVPKGIWLIETSFAGEREKDPLGTRNWFTLSLLRYGIARGWELRLSSEGLFQRRNTLGNTTGFADITLGFKKALSRERRNLPALGYIFQSKIPTASAGLGNKALEADLFLNGSKEWEGGWGLEVNLGTSWRKKEGYKGGFFQTQLLWAVEKKIEKRIGIFLHSAMKLPEQPNQGNSWVLGPGITWILKDDFQVDTSLTYGLTKPSSHRVWRIGLAFLR